MLLSAKKKRAFVSGQFELTGRCNLDCKMCYVHNCSNSDYLCGELSTNGWMRIFDEAVDNGLFFATLTGGECLLRQDFQELYLHLWKKRIMVTVFTNGTMINTQWIEFFKTYKPEHVQISLYGSSEEGYLRVTGHKGFEKTVYAIRGLKEVGIDVRVAVTPSRYMYEDYIPTLEFCRENGFRVLEAEMNLAANRDDKNKKDYFLHQEEIMDLSVRRAKLFHRMAEQHEVPEPCGGESEAIPGLKCTGGNCLAHITWDGKMHPCVNVMIGDGFDVRQLGFVEAWERTKAAAAEILLPVECIGCAYEKICVRCPVTRSGNKMDGHCDPAICEMTRALVAAGVKKLPTKAENNDD